MIYLDNAATSFPKPAEVSNEVLRCLREYGGNAGRGSHRLSFAANEMIYRCREELSSFFDFADPTRVAFTLNATAALNSVIKGTLKPGDHVLISDIEHNAVLRPILKLAKDGVISYDVFPSFLLAENRTDEMICAEIAKKIKKNTRLLVCNHASNICSVSMPIGKIGELCEKRNILFCVDASQSAGHLPISMRKMKIDALCAPGHKGLFGPQGCGFMILGNNVEISPLLEGGTGVYSLSEEMPAELPERMEAGTLPLPAIAGLLAGVRFLKKVGIEQIREHEILLNQRLFARISELPGIEIFAYRYAGSVLLFGSRKHLPDEIGESLSRVGFCVRTGYHCAPLAHRTLGTIQTGAVRVSPGFFNQLFEIDLLADAVEQMQ